MAKTITIKLSNRDVAALSNDLLDIEKWVQDAVKGKINKCKKRLVDQGQKLLRSDPSITSMPADDEGIIDVITARADYQDRVTRDTITSSARGN